MRERVVRYLPYNVGVAAVVGLGFGVMAPFGTGEAAVSLADRYLYWLIAIMLNWMQATVALTVLANSPLAVRVGAIRFSLLIAVALSFPASFEILWLNYTFFNSPFGNPAHLLEVWRDTLVVYALGTPAATALLLPYWQNSAMVISSPVRSEIESVPNNSVSPEPPLFFERIPRPLGNRLIALGMEDHYLRIYTDVGSDLVLCRFADALRELTAFDGLQVHRSWYVARSAIIQVQREGRAMTLCLSNGLEVPVSRAYQKEVAQGPTRASH